MELHAFKIIGVDICWAMWQLLVNLTRDFNTYQGSVGQGSDL